MTKLQEIQIDKLGDKLKVNYEYETVPIQMESYSRKMQCYSNVRAKIEKDGGAIHYGWSVHFTEGIIIEAERHAVWENEEEDLLCVTPHPSGQSELIFFSDNTPVDPQIQIDNVRMNITGNKIVNDWIYLSNSVGHIYFKYTDRINDDRVNMEKPVLNVINQIEKYRDLVMGLIKQNKGDRVNCYCPKGHHEKRKYLNCHSKFFKNEIPRLLTEIESYSKR
ncbi:hypothetical protein [Christiangramia sp. SM2212]|uniref:SEC-C motif-containing protein n=1 Tax=Christiangramia sediminicola TaxID=3073267 RepID=A0ABU1ESJ0_9FLAO|nr:hypothetical protein [Christiangramia sp. SM2212]MDR5591128.1 hypothetical protein [Christiangramia sp. SM2212]